MAQYNSLEEYKGDSANQQAFNTWAASQSGYIGKTKKAEWWNNAFTQNKAQTGLQDYKDGRSELTLSGTGQEQLGSLEGLNRGAIMYGQNINQTGEGIQRAVDKYTDRLEGTDPITEALKQQKQASQANVARNQAGRGVAGSIAAAGQEQAGRQKDIDIAASAYQQNAQNLKDYTNLQSNIAANQGMLEQVYRGNAVAGVQLQPVQNQGGVLSQLFG